MITVAQAQELISQHIHPLATKTVSLAEAHGCVLQEPVASLEDMPPFDRSAMDGYAIGRDDVGHEFEVVGEIRAGQVIDRQLEPGQAIRIFTGARLPSPGLKVVMQEQVEVHHQGIRLLQPGTASHVRLKGEDARAGETLLQPGAVLDATAVALLASLGKTIVRVSKPPTILHLTTGDEIVPPEQTPAAGQIRNSNASVIAGLFREHGIDLVPHLHAPDDLPSMLNLLAAAKVETYDLILISGGSGPGNYDFSAELFRHLGAIIHFRQVNVRPGKPMMFGTSPSQVVFGLPGNALSHFVCFRLFVRPALDRFLARPSTGTTQAFLVETMLETSNARETWWPALFNLNRGRLECRALPWKSSGDITRLPAANGLIKVPASTPQILADSMVDVLLTRNFF